MAEYREDYWQILEKLERERMEIQEIHDEALRKLFASRDANNVAASTEMDQYAQHSEAFDEAINRVREFKRKYSPYK